jgi:hypothetical protein
MTGQQLWEAARDGNAAKVGTLLSTKGAQSFINYQGEHRATPLHISAYGGHAAVTKQLIAAGCNVDLQEQGGGTALQLQIPVSYSILVQYAMIHHDMSPSLEAYVRASLNHLHVRMTQTISWLLPHDMERYCRYRYRTRYWCNMP